MLKQYILITGLLCCQLLTVEAQEMSLYFMNGIAQSTDVNPSFMPDRKTIYSFPEIYGGVSNSIGSYNGMIMKNAEGTTVLNTAALLSNAKDHNFVRQNLGLTTFRSMYGKERWRASVTHSIKQNTLFAYPKGLVNLLANGNAAYLDETLQIGPDVELNLYSETAFGFMMRISKVTVGGRIKLLSGLANVSTSKTDAKVTTDSEYYQLAVEADYQINAGGMFSVAGLVDDRDVEVNFEDEDLSFGRLFKAPNLGLDLGANIVLLNDKLMLSASIIDLGRIKWKNNAKNYTAKGTYDFSGVDLNDALDGGDAGEGLLDSLENAFDFVESGNSYSTMLPTKIYLSARYKAHRFLSLGVLSYLETYRGEIYNGLAIDATTHLGKIVDFGLTGSYVYRSPNLGAHLALKFGPFQIIAASDNLLALIDPTNHQHTTARFGMNLAFGKKYVGDSPNPVD
ncbi:MAG: hypothetical protein ACI8YQ_002843 [Polaribacter sp.]|jgi:hypothetical protein